MEKNKKKTAELIEDTLLDIFVHLEERVKLIDFSNMYYITLLVSLLIHYIRQTLDYDCKCLFTRFELLIKKSLEAKKEDLKSKLTSQFNKRIDVPG